MSTTVPNGGTPAARKLPENKSKESPKFIKNSTNTGVTKPIDLTANNTNLPEGMDSTEFKKNAENFHKNIGINNEGLMTYTNPKTGSKLEIASNDADIDKNNELSVEDSAGLFTALATKTKDGKHELQPEIDDETMENYANLKPEQRQELQKMGANFFQAASKAEAEKKAAPANGNTGETEKSKSVEKPTSPASTEKPTSGEKVAMAGAAQPDTPETTTANQTKPENPNANRGTKLPPGVTSSRSLRDHKISSTGNGENKIIDTDNSDDKDVTEDKTNDDGTVSTNKLLRQEQSKRNEAIDHLKQFDTTKKDVLEKMNENTIMNLNNNLGNFAKIGDDFYRQPTREEYNEFYKDGQNAGKDMQWTKLDKNNELDAKEIAIRQAFLDLKDSQNGPTEAGPSNNSMTQSEVATTKQSEFDKASNLLQSMGKAAHDTAMKQLGQYSNIPQELSSQLDSATDTLNNVIPNLANSITENIQKVLSNPFEHLSNMFGTTAPQPTTNGTGTNAPNQQQSVSEETPPDTTDHSGLNSEEGASTTENQNDTTTAIQGSLENPLPLPTSLNGGSLSDLQDGFYKNEKGAIIEKRGEVLIKPDGSKIPLTADAKTQLGLERMEQLDQSLYGGGIDSADKENAKQTTTEESGETAAKEGNDEITRLFNEIGFQGQSGVTLKQLEKINEKLETMSPDDPNRELLEYFKGTYPVIPDTAEQLDEENVPPTFSDENNDTITENATHDSGINSAEQEIQNQPVEEQNSGVTDNAPAGEGSETMKISDDTTNFLKEIGVTSESETIDAEQLKQIEEKIKTTTNETDRALLQGLLDSHSAFIEEDGATWSDADKEKYSTQISSKNLSEPEKATMDKYMNHLTEYGDLDMDKLDDFDDTDVKHFTDIQNHKAFDTQNEIDRDIQDYRLPGAINTIHDHKEAKKTEAIQKEYTDAGVPDTLAGMFAQPLSTDPVHKQEEIDLLKKLDVNENCDNFKNTLESADLETAERLLPKLRPTDVNWLGGVLTDSVEKLKQQPSKTNPFSDIEAFQDNAKKLLN